MITHSKPGVNRGAPAVQGRSVPLAPDTAGIVPAVAACVTLRAMRFEALEADAGERLDRFLANRLEDWSRSRVLGWVRDGRVRVDGTEERKASRKLRKGDSVEVEPAEPAPLSARPEPIEISILYEDEELAVIDKAAGMSVHAGAGNSSGTLVNALLHRFGTLSEVSGESRPGIVHRLDRFTTGVMVVAKGDRAHRRLQNQFQRRTVSKLYWAAVQGWMPPDPHDDSRLLRHGRPVMQNGKWWLRLEMPIRRDKRNRVKMAPARNGREAVSDVRVLRSGSQATLVEVGIHTGRTHQVRVHLSSAGHPVVGDTLYGARRTQPGIPLPGRYLLHARALGFDHPRTGRAMRFEAPAPPDFTAALATLGL